MESASTIIKHEYFELVKKLNQSNTLKNQKTTLYFYVDSVDPNYLKLFAAISDTQKILLCHRSHDSSWIESGFSDYPNLENYIVNLLRKYAGQDDLTKCIKSHIFKFTS